MREGEGQTNELYFEKSNEKDSQEGERMFTIPKQAIPRGQVFLPISHRRCKNLSLSLFLAFVVKKIIGIVICPGRIWIERVSFEVPQVYTERTVSVEKDTEFRHFPSHFS